MLAKHGVPLYESSLYLGPKSLKGILAMLCGSANIRETGKASVSCYLCTP